MKTTKKAVKKVPTTLKTEKRLKLKRMLISKKGLKMTKTMRMRMITIQIQTQMKILIK